MLGYTISAPLVMHRAQYILNTCTSCGIAFQTVLRQVNIDVECPIELVIGRVAVKYGKVYMLLSSHI
jgi:hypothetical protein